MCTLELLHIDVRIAIEERLTHLWSCQMIAFLVYCEYTRHPIRGYLSHTKWSIKIEPTLPCHMPLASRSREQSSIWQHHIVDCSNWFWYSYLKGMSRIFSITRIYLSTTKFSHPHFYHWNWSCRPPFVFIKLNVSLKVYFSAKNIGLWANGITFPVFTKIQVESSFQWLSNNTTKWHSFLKIR